MSKELENMAKIKDLENEIKTFKCLVDYKALNVFDSIGPRGSRVAIRKPTSKASTEKFQNAMRQTASVADLCFNASATKTALHIPAQATNAQIW